MEDPLNEKNEQVWAASKNHSEKRKRKNEENLNKKFKLISIMSYLGTQFKNYNLHLSALVREFQAIFSISMQLQFSIFYLFVIFCVHVCGVRFFV